MTKMVPADKTTMSSTGSLLRDPVIYCLFNSYCWVWCKQYIYIYIHLGTWCTVNRTSRAVHRTSCTSSTSCVHHVHQTVHHVTKCMSCHKAIVVITGRAHCNMITYILRSSCFCEIWALCVSWVTYDSHSPYILKKWLKVAQR